MVHGPLDVRFDPLRELPVVRQGVDAGLGGHGEARRHGDIHPRHLGQVGSLAAEQIPHGGAAIRLPGAEQKNLLIVQRHRSS